MKKTLYFGLFLLLAISCKHKNDPGPAESLPDDGINPTTETEIFDSITPVTGTLIKNMRIRNYYNLSSPSPTFGGEELLHYEYDDQQRLSSCAWQVLGSDVKVSIKFAYDAGGVPNKLPCAMISSEETVLR